jgi:hypothetical protein
MNDIFHIYSINLPGKGNKSIILSDFPPPRKSSIGLLQTGLLPAFIKVL